MSELYSFKFHLKDATVRALMADPLLPNDPTFADFRAALIRLGTEKFETKQEDIHGRR